MVLDRHRAMAQNADLLNCISPLPSCSGNSSFNGKFTLLMRLWGRPPYEGGSEMGKGATRLLGDRLGA